MKLFRKFDPTKAPNPIYKDEYIATLANIDGKKNKKKAKAAFEKAWETRNFEIELYWKRSQYFWAFQIPVFTAYFLLVNTTNSNIDSSYQYLVCCIGIIVSSAWRLINIGSKIWQRHWENHIDHMEDNFTGPLYKTISKHETYSVSKINELVSLFFMILWICLGLRYMYEKDFFNLCCDKSIVYIDVLFTVLTLFILWQMWFEHGKGMFQKREVTFFKRSTKINSGV